MSDVICPECGGYIFPHTEHCCPPAFWIWCSLVHSISDPGTRMHAQNHRDAVELWATIFGSGALHIPRVCVLEDAAGARPMWFEITGEVVVDYHAVEAEEPEHDTHDDHRES